jgi:hypothetical protein
MRSLDAMVDGMADHARHVLIGSATKQIVPFFHIQFKDRPDAIMPAPFSDERSKAAFIAAMREAMKAFKPSVVNYAFLSEAWTLEQDHEPREGDLPPSESERRKEVVIVSAGDHERATMKMWEIIRDDQARVTELAEWKAYTPDHFEGRLFNLLDEDIDPL